MAEALSIRELRGALTTLEERLAREGEVVITRRGEPIARVLPVGRRRELPSHRELRASMQLLAVGSEHLVREDRDAR
jgi:prevent-host-death family protein